MTDYNQKDIDAQRQVVRELMVLEARIARLRRELTKPIDYRHRQNQTDNVLEKELDLVERTSDEALTMTRNFIKAAKTRTGWAAYGVYKMRQHETDEAVRKADELFYAAQAEHEEAVRALTRDLANDPNPSTDTVTDSTDNKEQA